MPSWLLIISKVGMKVALNVLVPGISSVVDFTEAGVCFYNKDYIGGCISIGFGAANIISAGIFSAGKEAAQIAAKEASKTTAKDLAKSATKKVGSDLAKKIASNAISDNAKQTLIQSAKDAAKKATKTIGSQLAKEFAQGMPKSVTNEALKDTLQTSLKDITKEGVIGFVSSGGTDVVKGSFEYFGLEALRGVVEGGMLSPIKESFSSITANSAKQAASQVLNEAAKEAGKYNNAANTLAILNGLVDWTRKISQLHTHK
jgi:hypothetical protein